MTKPLERYGCVGPQKDSSLPAFHKLLETRWKTLKQLPSCEGLEEESSPLQLELLAAMGTYKDLHHSEVCPLKQGPQVRSAYCLHILNHVLKANSQVLAHNAQLRDQRSRGGAGLEDEPRDQGLTRPKVRRPKSEDLQLPGSHGRRLSSHSVVFFSLIVTLTLVSGPYSGPVSRRSSPGCADAH